MLLFWSFRWTGIYRSWSRLFRLDLDLLSESHRWTKRKSSSWLLYHWQNHDRISCYCLLLSTTGFLLFVSNISLLWKPHLRSISSFESPISDSFLSRTLISSSNFCFTSGINPETYLVQFLSWGLIEWSLGRSLCSSSSWNTFRPPFFNV